ncbi:recombination protein RecR [Candidatus Marinimicrobia bacterium MT.SAG.3]|nr:recombination protein RecR [Candidatus Marinimicrobia bacterium MT.SAG.3]
MSSSSPLLEKLVSELSKLPGIGRKSAQRLSFYFLKQSKSEVEELARTLIEVKDKIISCETCFNYTEISPCSICSSEHRNRSVICVVEEPTDLMAIERSGEYKGLYHVIGGVISPLDGIGPEDLHIKELLNRLDSVEEVIIATNPSIEGETTTLYLQREIKKQNIKVSRIARGIPMGSALEHADQVTLVRAFEGRMEI